MPGVFVAIEGLDGAGTSTQVDLLTRSLTDRGHPTYKTAEPSDGTIGRLLRRILKGDDAADPGSLALLFAADRLDHIQREIEPALKSHAVVLSDRFTLSSLAYQSLGLPMEWVATINGRARAPDATVFVRVSPEVAARRRAGRGGDPELFDADATQRQVAVAYEKALGMSRNGAIFSVDGDDSIENITAALTDIVIHDVIGAAE